MATNDDEQIVLGLDIPKTIRQINEDIKKLQGKLEKVKASGELDSRATVREINAQIAALKSQLGAIEKPDGGSVRSFPTPLRRLSTAAV